MRLMKRLRTGWLIDSEAAAREKLPPSATSTK